MEEMNKEMMENKVNETVNNTVETEETENSSIVPVLIGLGLVGVAIGAGVVKLTKFGSSKLTEHRIKKLQKQGYEVIVPADYKEVPEEDDSEVETVEEE